MHMDGRGISNTVRRELLAARKIKVTRYYVATEGAPNSTRSNKTKRFSYKGEWAYA